MESQQYLNVTNLVQKQRRRWRFERRNEPQSVLTHHNPIGKDEELDIWSEGTEHQASCHHHATENGHRTSPEVFHTGAADGTCRQDRRTGDGRTESSSGLCSPLDTEGFDLISAGKARSPQSSSSPGSSFLLSYLLLLPSERAQSQRSGFWTSRGSCCIITVEGRTTGVLWAVAIVSRLRPDMSSLVFFL